ncbi:hypothetical protein M2650_05530 [Luteimonas sp. SX5]|uniref:Uncharacterized protein n=1 Tax=Luteimonas galliterrae TaxID=2940486 RepID=A0ABT0MGU6_9GAMM|nr:hypothetical protein [Luteimonas galliterrae]MCL1634092.1 hypothetical protein [Luteimonas galliterrae]
MKLLFSLPLLLGLAGSVHAQNASECPRLPTVQLSWEQRDRGDTLLCRAIREDGSEAFGVSITPDAPYELRRSNRLGPGTVGEQSVYWYRGELATQPGVQVRETMFELADGRSVHIWLQAGSDAELTQLIGTVQAVRFDANMLSSK